MTLLVTQCRVGEVRTEQGGERVVCGGVEDCSKRERVGERCNDMVSCKKSSRLWRSFPIKRDKAQAEEKAAGIWTAGYASDLPPARYPHRIGFRWQAGASQLARLPNVVNVNLSNLHCRVLDQGKEEFLKQKIH